MARAETHHWEDEGVGVFLTSGFLLQVKHREANTTQIPALCRLRHNSHGELPLPWQIRRSQQLTGAERFSPAQVCLTRLRGVLPVDTERARAYLMLGTRCGNVSIWVNGR